MTDIATPFVLQDRDDRGVVTLTLNRPASFNALSEGMLGALEQALGDVAADETVRAVVIAAAGKAFCAGHDLKQMRAEPSLGYYQRLFERCGAMMLSIQRRAAASSSAGAPSGTPSGPPGCGGCAG
jgi:enoyl-CoA hydratase/carnithine racemase